MRKLQRAASFFLVALVLSLVTPGVAFAQYGHGTIYVPPPPTIGGGTGRGQNVMEIIGSENRLRTRTVNVRLVFPETNADQIAVSNREDFANVGWEPYTQGRDWELLPGSGIKQVYAKFRRSNGGSVSRVIRGTIELVGDGEPSAPASGDATCPVAVNLPYRLGESRAVYYIDTTCKKRTFTNPRIFLSYFLSWSDVRPITPDTLGNIPVHALGFIPWGPYYNPPSGTIVKSVNDYKVYLVLNGQKYWFMTAGAMERLGYSASWVEDVDDRLLAGLSTGADLTDSSLHPDGALIRYAGDSNVYRIEAGKKRAIANEFIASTLGYRLDHVASTTLVYPDGVPITQ